MRKTIVIALHLVAACGGASQHHEPQPALVPPMVVRASATTTIALADAIATGAVTVTARGAGVDHVELDVIAHADLALVVPSGTYFRGQPDGGFQNMIVTETTTAFVSAGSHAQLTLPTACTNFHRAAPGTNDRFVLATPDPALHRLVTCLEHTTIDASQRQTFVWALTDDVKREDLKSRRELLRPRLVAECQRRLHRSAATCELLVDVAYEATVDRLFERRDRSYAECQAQLP